MIRAPQYAQLQHNLFLLLSNGDSSCKKFFAACEEMDLDVVIKSRDMRDDYAGLTLLHEASRFGYSSAVQYLLNAGHAIDILDSSVSGVTPLMEAIMANHIDTVGMLVKCGASLTHQDVRGENAFHYAARSGSRIVKCLIRNCALSKDQIQGAVCVTNVKLKFPEDVAINSLTKEVLVSLRERGHAVVNSRAKVTTSKRSKR